MALSVFDNTLAAQLGAGMPFSDVFYLVQKSDQSILTWFYGYLDHVDSGLDVAAFSSGIVAITSEDLKDYRTLDAFNLELVHVSLSDVFMSEDIRDGMLYGGTIFDGSYVSTRSVVGTTYNVNGIYRDDNMLTVVSLTAVESPDEL